jgi:hypothetical protein
MEEFPTLIIRKYGDIADAFRAIQHHLQISNAQLEMISGIADQAVDKCLGPSRVKRIGSRTFDLLIGALAVQLRVEIDPAQARKVASRWVKRNNSAVRNSQPISQAMLDKCRPLILAELGHAGGIASAKARRRAQRQNGHASALK